MARMLDDLFIEYFLLALVPIDFSRELQRF